jgi:hypothetical protein
MALLFHWLGRQCGEGEEAITGFSEAVGDSGVAHPPLAQEGFAPLLELLRGVAVDHVVVVGRDLVIQPLRRAGEQNSMLVHCTTLRRHVAPDGRKRGPQAGAAIDDQELGLAQSAPDEVVENRPPGLCCFAAHFLHGEQDFLTILADAKHHQKRDRCAFPVELTRATCAIENQAYDRALRRASDCSRLASRPAPCAIPGSPRPCRSHR